MYNKVACMHNKHDDKMNTLAFINFYTFQNFANPDSSIFSSQNFAPYGMNNIAMKSYFMNALLEHFHESSFNHYNFAQYLNVLFGFSAQCIIFY